MDVDQAEAALGSPLDAEPGISDCTFWTFPAAPRGSPSEADWATSPSSDEVPRRREESRSGMD